MRSSGRSWFRCFAEVPGVSYVSDQQRRARLLEHDAVPEVNEFTADGKRIVALMWTTPDGSTSASPAHRLVATCARHETSEQTRDRVLSALELPGEILDYHFALQGAAELLYRRRRTEPSCLSFVEQLAWLDVKLVESHEPLFHISENNDDYIHVLTFDMLVRLYEREGFLHEALAVAERFARFLPDDRVGELRTRVSRLREEHA